MGLTKHMKMPVKTSCAMAAQQNVHLAQLLAQKQHFHIQLGCIQNEIRVFGSFGNEPMQSCSVHHVSLSLSSSSALALVSASVYSPPSDRFDHRSFISYKYMQLCP